MPHSSSSGCWNSIQTLVLKEALWYKDCLHGIVFKHEQIQGPVHRLRFGSKALILTFPAVRSSLARGLRHENDLEMCLPRWCFGTV